jgi:FMN reductase
MGADDERPPLIVGIGGTAKVGSSTEQALMIALKAAEREGACVRLFGGDKLIRLPHFLTEEAAVSTEAHELLRNIRGADGLLLASPGYHGSISGLVKNAIDYVEETAKDSRAYLDGIPVGLIATAYGWQATGSTLATLRAITHALRGWPTPLGATINCSGAPFKEGACSDPAVTLQLERVGQQVCDFARMQRHDRRARAATQANIKDHSAS